jgi:hypothetical protein
MQELLEHKWVRSPEAKLRARELEGTKEKIKEFNAKRKLKAGGNTCLQNSVLLTAVQYKYEPTSTSRTLNQSSNMNLSQ